MKPPSWYIFFYATICFMAATARMTHHQRRPQHTDKIKGSMDKHDQERATTINRKWQYTLHQHDAKTEQKLKQLQTGEAKRERRYHRILHTGQTACKSRRSVLVETIDELGDKVLIAPFIAKGEKAVPQILYETYCDSVPCNCRGIDSASYESACETTYMTSYANVIKEEKQEWSAIKIRTGCGCIIKKKRQNHHTSLLDLIA